MIQNVLSGIGGVGVYGVICVVLCFVVFLGVLVWVCRLKRSYLDAMSALPLHEATPRETESAARLQPETFHE